MTVYRRCIEDGPAGANPDTVDTAASTGPTGATTAIPQFRVGSWMRTAEDNSTGTLQRTKTFRYCKTYIALTQYSVYRITPNCIVDVALDTGGATPQSRLGVATATVASPTGAAYCWLQTSGYFDGVNMVSGTAATGDLYTSATAGYLSTSSASSAVLVNDIANIGTAATSATNKAAFSARELCVD